MKDVALRTGWQLQARRDTNGVQTEPSLLWNVTPHQRHAVQKPTSHEQPPQNLKTCTDAVRLHIRMLQQYNRWRQD